MKLVLPLDKMTTSDKLSAMERLWDDLCRNAETVPSPKWHGDILSARDRSVREGGEGFADWNEAKDRIRKSVE